MALSIDDKKRIVADISSFANDSSSLVLADARGLNVSEANQLRSEGHKSNVKFIVVKNTLVKLAFKGTTYEGLDDYLIGPTMLGFSYDEPGAAAKLLKTYAKNFDELEIKALVVEGQLLDGGQIDILATLPSKEEAYGLIANVLQAPISKFATLLNEVPSKLARVLSAVRDKKEASA